MVKSEGHLRQNKAQWGKFGEIKFFANLNNFQVIIHLNLILRKIKHTFSLKNFLKTFGNQFVTFNKNKTNTFRSALDLWKVELNKD